MGFFQILLILLLVLPAAGAIVVACLGQSRALLVRQISLGVSVAGAVIPVIVTLGFLATRSDARLTTYQPEFVPGATADGHATTWNLIDFDLGRDSKAKSAPKLGAIQFFIGIDGMNVWLILLTSILMVSS